MRGLVLFLMVSVVVALGALITIPVVEASRWALAPGPTLRLCVPRDSGPATFQLEREAVELSLRREEQCGYGECSERDERWFIVSADVVVRRQAKVVCRASIPVAFVEGKACLEVEVDGGAVNIDGEPCAQQ